MEIKQKWSLWALSTVPLVMTLGNSMLIPVLPSIENKLNISDFQVSLIITIYSVFAILFIPIAGYISDRIGRKKVIIPSLILAGVGGLITGWVSWKVEHPFNWIIIGRIIQGIGSAGALPVVMPCVGDLFKNEKDVSCGLGLIETSNTFGKVLSPILGSAIAAIIWFMPFFAIPVLCVIAIMLILFLVPTPKKTKKSQYEKKKKFKVFIKSIKKIFKYNFQWLLAIFLLGIIIMFILFGVQFYLSSILEKQYDIVGIKKGLILAIPLSALSFTSYKAGKKIGSKKDVMKKYIFRGFFLISLSFIIPLFLKHLLFMIITLIICGIGIGFALPSLDALVTEGIEKEERGTVSSIYSSMRFVGVALGPPLFAYLMKKPTSFMFFLCIFLGVLGIIVTVRFIKPTRQDLKPKKSH